jgi:AbrB family looped-hinge helix DNA binding protein
MSDTWPARIEPDGPDGRIELPSEALKRLGIRAGDSVSVIVRDGAIHITPIEPRA